MSGRAITFRVAHQWRTALLCKLHNRGKPGHAFHHAEHRRGAAARRAARRRQDPRLHCRCLPSGRLSYALRYTVKGKRRTLALGVGITPAKARELAEQRRARLPAAKTRWPSAQAERKTSANTVAHVLDEHIREHVKGDAKLRSAKEIERCFDVYVKPEIGTKSIYELRRSDIRAMHDKIAERGLVMADRVLRHLSKAFNWWANGDDDFSNPIIRGMARTSTAKRARKRVLDDPEIRDVWKALDVAKVPDCYRRLVRFLLVSARRRGEAAEALRWERVEGDVWIVPGDEHKTGDEAGDMVVPVTSSMLAQMGEPQKRGLVFHTGDGAPLRSMGGASASGISTRLSASCARPRGATRCRRGCSTICGARPGRSCRGPRCWPITPSWCSAT